MILTSSRRISQPRRFIPIYDEGEYTERVSSVTGEVIRVTNKYYMVDDVGGDFIVSKVIFDHLGCIVINDNERIICYKGKYKEKYGGVKEEIIKQPIEE